MIARISLYKTRKGCFYRNIEPQPREKRGKGAKGKYYCQPLPRAAAAGAGAGTGGTGATAASFVNPRCFRSSVSIFFFTSGLSFKNWRAFSRPWPILSPLYPYHDPL